MIMIIILMNIMKIMINDIINDNDNNDVKWLVL